MGIEKVRKKDLVRMLVGVLDIEAIPSSVEIVVGECVYDIFFKVEVEEVVVVDENIQQQENHERDDNLGRGKDAEMEDRDTKRFKNNSDVITSAPVNHDGQSTSNAKRNTLGLLASDTVWVTPMTVQKESVTDTCGVFSVKSQGQRLDEDSTGLTSGVGLGEQASYSVAGEQSRSVAAAVVEMVSSLSVEAADDVMVTNIAMPSSGGAEVKVDLSGDEVTRKAYVGSVSGKCVSDQGPGKKDSNLKPLAEPVAIEARTLGQFSIPESLGVELGGAGAVDSQDTAKVDFLVAGDDSQAKPTVIVETSLGRLVESPTVRGIKNVESIATKVDNVPQGDLGAGRVMFGGQVSDSTLR